MRAMIVLAAAILGVQGAALPNSIGGRVTGPDGAGVAGVVITVLERTDSPGGSRIHPVNVKTHVLTDAHGDYLLTQVPLGEVFVVAIPKNAALADGRLNRSGYGVTYYPSAARVEEALPITVNVRAAQKADIRLTAVPLAAVSGVVFDSHDRPATSGTLLVARGDHLFGVDGGGVPLHPDGSFGIAGLSPGTYFLQYREGTWPPPRDVTPLVSGATVVIDGKDTNGVRVTPIHMVRGSGRVIVPEELRGDVPRAGVTVGTAPIDSEGNPGPARPGGLKDDLTFEFATWPGPHRLVVSGMPYAWRIKAVRYRGADVTSKGINFTGPDVVSGIEIELERGVR
jgi:hypothetical protein